MWLYGAGGDALSLDLGISVEEARKLNGRFLRNFPSIKNLKYKVGEKFDKQKYLKGLDGRRLPVRSKHSSLNTLLQSGGAIVAKVWLVFSYRALIAAGYKCGWDGDFVFLAWVHDEIQIACREGLEDEISTIVCDCAVNAGERLSLRIPIAAESRTGNNWAECH